MERINIEDARIRVEFRKNETNEVIKNEWFNVISFDNNETIDLCKYFYTEDDEYFKEAFFYWLDNYHYKLLGSDILDLIDRAKDGYVGYYEDTNNFVEEMFDAEYPNCPENLRFYIDFDLYKRDLMYDYFEIDGHIFRQ